MAGFSAGCRIVSGAQNKVVKSLSFLTVEPTSESIEAVEVAELQEIIFNVSIWLVAQIGIHVSNAACLTFTSMQLSAPGPTRRLSL